MDVEQAIADFAASDWILSRTDLETALSELLIVFVKSDADVSFLLNALACSIQGLLEAVLTSGNRNASKFRTRVLKEARQPSSVEAPAFRTTVERLGAFLLDIPEGFTVDRTITEPFNALMNTIRALNSPESQPSGNTPNREQAKAGKKKQRNSQVQGSNKKDASSLVKASEQTTKFFENFFEHCTEGAIEQFALNNLLNIMSRNLQPPSPLEPKQREPSSPIAEKSPTDGRARSNSLQSEYLPLGFDEIAKQLESTASFKSGDWQVVVSQRAIKHIKQAASDKSDLSLLIEKKIKQLSVGYFPAPNQTNLLSRDFGVPIYTADVNEELRLIYHIDVGAPTSSGQETQFIRIFDMQPKSKIITAFWRSVATQLARRGSDYIKRCSERAETRIRFKRVETTPPKVYPSMITSQLQDAQWQGGADVETNEEHSLELHRILALEKFIPFSQTFFDGQSPPFLNTIERLPDMKPIAIQKHDETNFVFAVSSTENQIINHHSSCIVLGRSGTGKTTCLLFRMLALDIAAEKCGRPVRQMFITQSLKLANQVRSQFLQMRQTQVEPSPSLPVAQRSGLSLKELEEKTAEGALPAKFSQLDDSHFPLFLTFDQLCKLLEADYDLYFKPSDLPATEDARLEGSSESKRGPLISFDYFQAKIWPRFERLKKGLHPNLVYSEFMGVIKGSEACLKLQKPYLDRDSYEMQSARARSSDPAERSRIYTLFEVYLRLRSPSSYDMADRVRLLLSTLQENGIPGKYLDFLYVDEVQDHLILDAALLKSLCPNPHGLFFAGDTAQTISAGSTFRFSELKSVLYSLERQDVNVKRGARKPVDPYFFQLSTNYRSHSGIVDAAAFIVSLIDSYYPHSIDSLAPEVSVVDVSAHKPTFFSGRSNFSDLLRFISYNRGGLGAQQVIIVRDEEASQRLQESIGTAAIVLTLYESKGMEFDDVLLYNFFSDSPATATDWRGLLRAQQENKTFDERRHSILQSELKSLYVGLTRARERVWELLVAATIVTSHDMRATVPQVGVSSSLEEWRDRGQQFFVDKLFSEAALCFTKAKLDWWTTVARTYYDRQLAVRLAEDGEQPVAAFAKLAQEFEALAGSVEHAYNEEDSRVLFANAAECLATLPDHKAAADAFFKAERYTESASHYHSAGLLDRAIEIVARHPVNEEVSGVVKYAAKIAYAKRSDVASLHKAWKLCDNKDEFIKFLEDHGFEEQEIVFLESVGDYTHAGQLLWDRGDHLSALLQFRRSKTLLSRSKAAKCLLEALRANVPLGASFEEPFQPLLHLFSLCHDTEFSDSQRAEVDLLQAVATLDSEELEMHGMRCHKSGDDRGVVLALYSWASSDGLLALESESDERVEEILTLYHALGQAISSLAEWPRIDDLPFQQLFGISGTGKARYTAEDDLTVHPDSFIYSHVLVMRGGYRYLDLIDEPNFVTAPKYAIEELIRTKLLSELRNALDSVEMIARKSRTFDLCSPFTNTGKCAAAGQGHCWRDHIRADEFTIQRFNMKLRLLFLLIRVLDLSAPDLDGFETGRNHALNQRRVTWVPDYRRLGNISDIIPALIPGYQEAIQTVKSWLREVFESLTPSDQPRFFLTHLLLTSLLATAFDYTEAQSYLWEGQWSLDTDVAAQDGLLHPTNHTPLATFVVVWLAGVTPTGGVEFLA
ncbi:hypothetical protein FRC04_003269 [Tulasnella sp. 424]|nr:hypothetical protein FRC04_003269 [Tulasnella sp. 424]